MKFEHDDKKYFFRDWPDGSSHICYQNGLMAYYSRSRITSVKEAIMVIDSYEIGHKNGVIAGKYQKVEELKRALHLPL